MTRYRLASLILLAGLGLIQGCAAPSCEGGGWFSRLGFGRRGVCECTPTCGSGGQVIVEGNGPAYDGPMLDPQGPPALPPGVGIEPPIAPAPRPYAQPLPSGPVSRLRVIDPAQR